jgi:hypothetical protein
MLQNRLKTSSGHVRPHVDEMGHHKICLAWLSFDQNIRLGTPCVVAKSKRIVLNRRNSPHVRGSERVLFVAWRMVVLKYSSGKK